MKALLLLKSLLILLFSINANAATSSSQDTLTTTPSTTSASTSSTSPTLSTTATPSTSSTPTTTPDTSSSTTASTSTTPTTSLTSAHTSATDTPPPVISTPVVTSVNGSLVTTVVTVVASSSSSSSTSSPQATSSAPPSSSSSSSLGTGSIIGLSVAGGVTVIGLVAFFIWKFTRKRFSDFDDGEAIKWPDLNTHGGTADSHPLPVHNTGRAGFDTGSEPSLSRVNSNNYSTADFHSNPSSDPYAVPPLPHLNPNQPYRDDPGTVGTYYDPYKGPIPGTIDQGASQEWSGEAIPMTQMNPTGRMSPGPNVAYNGEHVTGRQSPYGGRASPGPQAAYGGRMSPGPQAAYVSPVPGYDA